MCSEEAASNSIVGIFTENIVGDLIWKRGGKQLAEMSPSNSMRSTASRLSGRPELRAASRPGTSPLVARSDTFLSRLDELDGSTSERAEHDKEVQRLNEEMQAFQRRLRQQSLTVQADLSKPLPLAPPTRHVERKPVPTAVAPASPPPNKAFGEIEEAVRREKDVLEQQLERAGAARHRSTSATTVATQDAERASRLARASMPPSQPVRGGPRAVPRAAPLRQAPPRARSAAVPASPRGQQGRAASGAPVATRPPQATAAPSSQRLRTHRDYRSKKRSLVCLVVKIYGTYTDHSQPHTVMTV